LPFFSGSGMADQRRTRPPRRAVGRRSKNGRQPIAVTSELGLIFDATAALTPMTERVSVECAQVAEYAIKQ
jgi:hypothetical protein